MDARSNRRCSPATSSIQLAQPDGAAGQQLFAQYIDLSLAADGSVTALAGRDGVRMELLALGQTPARTITSTTLDGSGEAGKGLTALTFEGAPDRIPETTPRRTCAWRSGRTLKAQLASERHR